MYEEKKIQLSRRRTITRKEPDEVLTQALKVELGWHLTGWPGGKKLVASLKGQVGVSHFGRCATVPQAMCDS